MPVSRVAFLRCGALGRSRAHVTFPKPSPPATPMNRELGSQRLLVVIEMKSLVYALQSRLAAGQALFIGLDGLPSGAATHCAPPCHWRGVRGLLIVTMQVFSFWRPWGFSPLET